MQSLGFRGGLVFWVEGLGLQVRGFALNTGLV